MGIFSIIVAVDSQDGIARDGKIPWDMPEDRKFFKRITQGGTVIMGRKTWDSLPSVFRPLPGRKNIVLSRTVDEIEGAIVCRSLGEALENSDEDISTYIIGGKEIYQQAMNSPFCMQIIKVNILKDYDCDLTFPKIPDNFVVDRQEVRDYKEKDEAEIEIDYYYRNAKNLDEIQYLKGLVRIMNERDAREDRTGVGTIATFNLNMTFNLRNQFPLLTTKSVYWKGVVEEALFFLRGETNSLKLEEKKVNIWKANTTEEWLRDHNLDSSLKPGEIGPLYGFQWRNWGADYQGSDYDYSQEGIDQVAKVLDSLKNNPFSRRHIISAWNVSALDQGVLPPCHIFFQFYVRERREKAPPPSSKGKGKEKMPEDGVITYRELSCMTYMRSADMALGVPFNIASYALITYIFAQILGYRPGDFHLQLGDAHIYKNHIDGIKEQITRLPMPSPQLKINAKLESVEDLENLTFEDFELQNYNPYPKIKFEMNA